MAIHFDQDAIDAEAAADGWYALLILLTSTQTATAEVFRRYKGQHVVERRYSQFKGPPAIAPIFLALNRRITALITVICLALLIFCLGRAAGPRGAGPARWGADRPTSYSPTPPKPTGHFQQHWPTCA